MSALLPPLGQIGGRVESEGASREGGKRVEERQRGRGDV